MNGGRLAFETGSRDPGSGARSGLIRLPRGTVPTPAFMPVGTAGTVKGVTPDRLREIGPSIILANTYHLWLRPGPAVVKAHGSLHRFMAWDRPILTDSGGFQVFSLAALRRVTSEGVAFRSHIDGSARLLTPELSISIQQQLGSDIMMAFDWCPEGDAPKATVAGAVQLTTDWAGRCLAVRDGPGSLFGIVQGGVYDDLRAGHAAELGRLPFDGFAIGGLSVGEAKEDLYRVASLTAPLLPEDRPRYLMGVGSPVDLVICIGLGIDMFDCVMPTRNARNGTLFTARGPMNIKRLEYESSLDPVEDGCDCYTCRTFSRAYLRHLYRSGEINASVLNTIHNLRFYQRLMEACREAIERGGYAVFRDRFLAAYRDGEAGT